VKLRGLVLLVVVACAVVRSAAAFAAAPAGGADVVFVSPSGVVTIADASRPGELRVALPNGVTDASASPDGSLLAYSTITIDDKLETTFAVADRRTGRPRWELPGVLAGTARWAPVGARLAFGRSGELWLGGADRRDLQRVSASFSGGYDWKPDGRELAFASPRGLVLFDLRTRGRRVLVRGTNVHDPAWSPDRASLAYIRSTKLSVVAATGTGPPRQLARGVSAFQWSPDGMQLAYLKRGDLFLVDRSGGFRARRVGRNVLDFDWSPDSRLLTFSSRTPVHPPIFTVARTGRSLRRLTVPPTPNNDRSPLWSPDGKQIVFLRSAGGVSRVYVVDVADGHERPIVGDDLESEACSCGFSWLKKPLRLPAPTPLVPFQPTKEVTSGSFVAGLAVDGGEAAALLLVDLGEGYAAWDSTLWSPATGDRVGAHLQCDGPDNQTYDDVFGPALAGDRYAYLCIGDEETLLYTGTLEQPQPSDALDLANSADVRIAGAGALLVASVDNDLMRFDGDGKLTPLGHFPQKVWALDVDQNRVLIALDADTLRIVAADGTASPSLSVPFGGGVVLRGSRLVTLDRGILAAHDLSGETLQQRTVPADAVLDDVAGDLVLYTTHSRLHLLRLDDGRDIALQLHDQTGPPSAHFTADGGIVVGYDTNVGSLLAYLQPEGVTALLATK
jgi:dipeptidyl aminopeptidase/acylaminoacyl peptidase